MQRQITRRPSRVAALALASNATPRTLQGQRATSKKKSRERKSTSQNPLEITQTARPQKATSRDIQLPRAVAASRRAVRRRMPDQSPDGPDRQSRIDGYQGVASPSCIHRQSQQNGSSVQTGRPSAPARCTVELSTEITRSSAAILAQKSSRSLIGSQSVPSSRDTPKRLRAMAAS